MIDMATLTVEARWLHDIFVSLFYGIAGLLLALGVLQDMFRLQLGQMPGPMTLVARVVISALLLSGYDEIANAIRDVAGALAAQIGDVAAIKHALEVASEALKSQAWSWSSIGDSIIFVIAYLSFLLLHVTVFIFDAGVTYVWIILYVTSPLLIAFYILPQTASATGSLFRALIEVSLWKVLWAIFATLLWSTAARNLEHPTTELNFVSLLTYVLLLALSMLGTPLLVKSIVGHGLTAATAALGTTAGTAVITAAIGGGASMKSLATGPASKVAAGGRMAVKAPISAARSYLEKRREEREPAKQIRTRSRYTGD